MTTGMSWRLVVLGGVIVGTADAAMLDAGRPWWTVVLLNLCVFAAVLA